MTSRLFSRAVACCLLFALAACQTWRPMPVAPSGEAFARTTRLTLMTDQQLTMTSALIRPDSIIGTSEFGEAVRVATSDVRSIEVHELSTTRTVGLLVTHASILVSAVALIIHVQPHYRGAF